MSELESLLQTLVFDGELEEVSPAFANFYSSFSSTSGVGGGSVNTSGTTTATGASHGRKSKSSSAAAAVAAAAAASANASQQYNHNNNNNNLPGMLTVSSNSVMYQVAKEIPSVNALTDAPCGMCPVASQCCDGGIVSPQACVYLTQWLAMSKEEEKEEADGMPGEATLPHAGLHDIEDLYRR